VGALRGWDMHDVALLFGVGATSFGLMQAVAGGALHLSRFIDEGALDAMLVQPKPTLGYALGCRSQASGFGDVASGVVFLWLSGAVTLERVPWAVASVLCASVVFTASSVLFFSLAFWLPRTHATSRQALDVLVTFALYPEPLFRGVLRVVLFSLIPAGFVAYLPVQIIRSGGAAELACLVSATLAYVWLARRVFHAGLRRYSSGSRFGLLT
jgi:ABC-2 type transport system permease protein